MRQPPGSIVAIAGPTMLSPGEMARSESGDDKARPLGASIAVALGCGIPLLGLMGLVAVIGLTLILPFERPVDARVVEARAEPASATLLVEYVYEDARHRAQVDVSPTDEAWGAVEGDTITLWVDGRDGEDPAAERFFADTELWWALAGVVVIPLVLAATIGLPIDGVRWLLRRRRT